MNVEPFRWEDGALLVLDQRALPGEERWIRCETAEQVADCIRTLAVRGAPAIGIAAAYAMALAASRGEDLEAAAAMLRATRPTAVNLGWALDRVLEAGDGDLLALARAGPRGSARRGPAAGAARRGALRAGRPRAHALQRRRARHRRLRHRRGRAARRLGGGPA